VLFFDGTFGLLVLAVWIFCVIESIVTPAELCRNLPKLAWVFVTLLFPLMGSIAWIVAGRPWNKVPAGTSGGGRSVWSASTGAFGGDRPRRVPSNPDDDEDFLAGLRQRAEEQRRRAREDDGDGGPNTTS
jgi:hypothetical protein